MSGLQQPGRVVPTWSCHPDQTIRMGGLLEGVWQCQVDRTLFVIGRAQGGRRIVFASRLRTIRGAEEFGPWERIHEYTEGGPPPVN